MGKARERIVSILSQWRFANCECQNRSLNDCPACIESLALEKEVTDDQPADVVAVVSEAFDSVLEGIKREKDYREKYDDSPTCPYKSIQSFISSVKNQTLAAIRKGKG